MKKTMRKILAAVLCMLMLMTVMPLQSFAAFTSFEKPDIKQISVSEDSKISIKELNNYFDRIDETIEYYNEIFDENYTIETLPEQLREWILNYYLSDCIADAEYVVTFTNGDTLDVGADTYINEINNNYNITVDGWVEYEDYLYAVQNNKNTVAVTVEAEVYSTGIFSSYEKKYNFEAQADVVDCFVKSFEALSGVPDKLYDDADFIELEGAEFLIVYADGTKKTATVTVDVDGDDILDGQYIEFYEEDGILYVYFIDEIYEQEVDVLEFPFEKIEFKDYSIDGNHLTVNYTIGRKDGTVTEYTKSFDGLFSGLLISGIIDEVDGYYIRLSHFNGAVSGENNEKLKLYICAGELYSNGLEYEFELPDEVNFITKIIERIQSIIDFFRNLFSSLLSKIGLVA